MSELLTFGTHADIRRVALDNHARQAEVVMGMIRDAASRHDDDLVLELTHRLVQFQLHSHSGWFGLAEIEQILTDLAARRLPVPDPAPPRNGRVLHIMTEAYASGGHTPFGRRWISQHGRRTDLLLTRSGNVPDNLVAAVVATGGQAFGVDFSASPLSRAATVRAIAAPYDLIVLNIHPDDPIPVVGLAYPDRPPTIFIDHLDNACVLGNSITDVHAVIRESGHAVATRRGIPHANQIMVPIPVDAPTSVPDDDPALRQELGIPDDARIALTVGTAHKYGRGEWLDTVAPLLDQHASLNIIAVGPDASSPGWADAATRWPGRIHALGQREGLDAIYRAADLIIDSYPIKGITTLLEAGTHGVPGLTISPADLYPPGIDCDAPGLDSTLSRVTDPDSLQTEMHLLVTDDEVRLKRGREAASEIIAHHTGAGWIAAIVAATELAEQRAASRTSSVAADRRHDQVDLAKVGQSLHTSARSPMSAHLRAGSVPWGPDAVSLVTVLTRSEATMLDDWISASDLDATRLIVVVPPSDDDLFAFALSRPVTVVLGPMVGADARHAWLAGVAQVGTDVAIALSCDLRLPRGWEQALAPTCVGPDALDLAVITGDDVRPDLTHARGAAVLMRPAALESPTRRTGTVPGLRVRRSEGVSV